MCPSGDHGGVPAKSAESHVLSFIWYAANKSSMRNVASRFDLAESSVHRMLQRVADFIIEMGPTVLTFPDDMEKLSRDFEKVSGVPGVVGCIDGSYIKIQCPKKKVAATYCNRHHYLSITLQAVCDNRRRSVDVLVGSSSRTHDARVFRQSSLTTKLPGLCQGDKCHLLGDAAYPLRQYHLTPYRDYRNLSKAQREFNKKFSATRVLIENAFSSLNKRFRQLMYLELHTVDWLNKFIVKCCILHSFFVSTNSAPAKSRKTTSDACDCNYDAGSSS
ncbi:putative nuclease HARBI1 [Ornithodoros turicata]|uniref:putative nuclease HARBI1 n=1 Tax=Ornithodoros turicata TaxID=34597 RepID=UPI003138789A